MSGTGAEPGDGAGAEPGGGPGAEPGDGTGPEPHVAEGLDLARAMARAVTGSARVVRRRQAERRSDRRATPPRSSGAHPDDRDPQPLGRAMDRLVASQGWATEVSVHTLLGRWPTLVGPVNAAHATPVGYADGILTVRTDSTAWATSLRAMAPQLVAKLNEALGDGTVTRITVLGPDAPSWKRGRRSVQGRGPRDTYG